MSESVALLDGVGQAVSSSRLRSRVMRHAGMNNASPERWHCTMRVFLLLLLALPGCQYEVLRSPSTPLQEPNHAVATVVPEPVAPTASSSAPAASQPEAPWRDGLPAVSDDGTTIAVANDVSLGARGDSRVQLDLIDVARDETVRRIVVFDPDFPMARSGEPKARRVLGETSWVKLSSGDGLSLEYREPVLVVRDVTTGRELLRKAEPRWSEKAGPRCPGCADCPAPLANVTQVWSDHARGLLLVAVGFLGGSDLCWEPSDEYHVVRLPPGT
jgi:hypothetical protein